MKVKVSEQQTNNFHNGLMITDHRRYELCEIMETLHIEMIKKRYTIAQRFSRIAQECKNINELIFCTCTDTLFLVKEGMLKF